MLYVTARDHRDAYTAHRALTQDRADDGGLFAPLHLPRLSDDRIAEWISDSFGSTMAQILNLFFGSGISASQVEFAVGRKPVRLKPLSHRIVFAETWHNPGEDWHWCARRLSRLLLSRYGKDICSEWMGVAVRIGMLFDAYGQLCRKGIVQMGEPVDASFVSGDFSGPMAARYARELGLPIGEIICCCNENNGLWELLHQGSFSTNAVAVNTPLPEADIAVPASLERLVFACGGTGESAAYLEICRRGGEYVPGEALLKRMKSGLSVSVVGSERTANTVRTVFGTYDYLMDPATALAYAGLLDYRATRGAGRYALVLSPCAPGKFPERTASALKIPVSDLKQLTEQL